MPLTAEPKPVRTIVVEAAVGGRKHPLGSAVRNAWIRIDPGRTETYKTAKTELTML